MARNQHRTRAVCKYVAISQSVTIVKRERECVGFFVRISVAISDTKPVGESITIVFCEFVRKRELITFFIRVCIRVSVSVDDTKSVG